MVRKTVAFAVCTRDNSCGEVRAGQTEFPSLLNQRTHPHNACQVRRRTPAV